VLLSTNRFNWLEGPHRSAQVDRSAMPSR
jgi:hypothetical protein